jgi:hypothetical protein
VIGAIRPRPLPSSGVGQRSGRRVAGSVSPSPTPRAGAEPSAAGRASGRRAAPGLGERSIDWSSCRTET